MKWCNIKNLSWNRLSWVFVGWLLVVGSNHALDRAVKTDDNLRADAVREALRADSPQQAVAGATQQVLDLISAGQSYAEDDPDRFYTEVEALIRPLIDFQRFARNVMGPAYKKATPEQRVRFAESFKWGLVKTYALALTEFHDGKVNVLPPRRPSSSPKKAKVTQEISIQGKTYVAVYLMQRNKKNMWRVQNIIIEGINIGVNYKTQFAAALKNPSYGGDMDKVIDAWGGFDEGHS